jgi:PAS domain S-box-containing protein
MRPGIAASPMPPKTIKKNSSLKKQTPQTTRRATSTGQLAEGKVLASRDLLRQIIDINPHFVFAGGQDGRFTLANQAVADCYGTTIEGLIGKTDADFNPNRTEVELFLKMDREAMDSKKERFIPEEVITDVAGKSDDSKLSNARSSARMAGRTRYLVSRLTSPNASRRKRNSIRSNPSYRLHTHNSKTWRQSSSRLRTANASGSPAICTMTSASGWLHRCSKWRHSNVNPRSCPS